MIEEMTEVIFEFEPWEPGRKFPVTLITYLEGHQDLHAQTGRGHLEAIEAARKILWKRKLAISPLEAVGPSGAYYSVRKLK